jgi:membrane glycosyltransferase
MDSRLNSAVAYERATGGMPSESPLGMPPQDLRYNPAGRERARPTAAVLYARFILIATTVGVSTYGIYQMLQVVRFASMTVLQGLMIFFFAVSLAWIAFAAGSVLAGASKRREPRTAGLVGADTLTALVMPIYNEDPTRTTTALQAMAEALAQIGAHPRNGRDRPSAPRSCRYDAGLVSPTMAKRGAQIGQRRGLRNTLGRPLPLYDRAGRR